MSGSLTCLMRMEKNKYHDAIEEKLNHKQEYTLMSSMVLETCLPEVRSSLGP